MITGNLNYTGITSNQMVRKPDIGRLDMQMVKNKRRRRLFSRTEEWVHGNISLRIREDRL